MSKYKIPKIFHFVCITPMKFELYHYLAIVSTHFTNSPEKIYVYVDSEPRNNFLWESVRQYVTIERITVHKQFRGVEILHPQYQADIIRLEKLIQRGGVYLDIDTFVLKSFDDDLLLLSDHETVMGGDIVDDKIETLSNAIILSVPNSAFLQLWYDTMDKYMYNGYPWAYHAVCLPKNILAQRQDLHDKVKVLSWNSYFRPFGWKIKVPFIFDNNRKDEISKLDAYYTVVFYQTIVYDKYLKNLTVDYFNKNDNIFTTLFSKYVMELKKYKASLYKSLWSNYNSKLWQSLEFNADIFVGLFVGEPVDKDYTYALFFLAFAQYKLEKFHKSKENYEKLLDFGSNLNKELLIWTNSNMELLKDIDLLVK